MPDASIIVPTIMEETPPVVDALKEGNRSLDDFELLICRGGSAATARNDGIESASSNKLIFLDDDSLPSDGYLDAALAALEEYSAVRGRVKHYGSRYNPGDWYDRGDKQQPCDVLIGCNMAVRREVIDEVGGFDQRLPFGHEETEWSDRISNKFEIYYVPDMLVRHQYASSFVDFTEKQYRHARESITYKHVIQGVSLPSVLFHSPHPPNFVDSPMSAYGEVVRLVGIASGVLRFSLRKI